MHGMHATNVFVVLRNLNQWVIHLSLILRGVSSLNCTQSTFDSYLICKMLHWNVMKRNATNRNTNVFWWFATKTHFHLSLRKLSNTLYRIGNTRRLCVVKRTCPRVAKLELQCYTFINAENILCILSHHIENILFKEILFIPYSHY